MDSYKVLHIGINSSVPIIFSTFCEKVYLMYRPAVERIFKEQEGLETIKSSIDISKKRNIFKRSREIRRIVKDMNINIVFINRKDDMIATKLAFLFKRKRPLIIGTFHNPQAWIDDKRVKAFIPLMKWCLDGHLAMASFAYKKLVNYHFPKNRMIFFQNYIKFESFKQKQSYSYSSPFKICYSGTIDPRKNELFIAKAVALLKQNFKIQYDIYGPFNDEEYKHEFLGYICKEKLDDCIHVYPRLSPSDEQKAFVEHDLYISSSKYEMCPLNILNAKACAMPILISDTPGQQDLVDDGIDGFKYREDDMQDIISKLTKLQNDEALRKTVGESAYKAISETKSYLVAAKRLESFIKQLESLKR